MRGCVAADLLVVVLDVESEAEEDVVPDEHLHSENKEKRRKKGTNPERGIEAQSLLNRRNYP